MMRFRFFLTNLILLSFAASVAAEVNNSHSIEFVTAGTCGDDGGAERLRDELALRLPDARFAEPASDNTRDGEAEERWLLLWVPGTDGKCEIIIRSTAGQMILDLEGAATDDELRFVASRVSWLVTIDDTEEQISVLEAAEDIEEPSSESMTDARNQATELGSELRSQLRNAVQSAKSQSAKDRSIQNAAEQATDAAFEVLTGVDELFLALQTRPPAPEQRRQDNSIAARQPFSAPAKGTKVTLFPNIVVAGQEHEVPRFALNFIGGNRAFRGAEFGVYNRISWYGSGLQFGVAGNRVGNQFRGTQAAFGTNRTRVLSGTQLAGFVNLVTDEARGVQAAGFVNYASKGAGIQASPMINYGGSRWTGLQIGLINVGSDVRGVQLGLINLSRSAAAPIGLFNLAIDYPPRIWLWTGAPAHAYLGVRTGGKYLRYGFALGHRFAAEGEQNRSVGLSVGFHLPGDPFFGDIDLITMAPRLGLLASSDDQIHQLRATLGWKYRSYMSLVGGLALTRMESTTDDAFSSPMTFETNSSLIWPELVLGVVF